MTMATTMEELQDCRLCATCQSSGGGQLSSTLYAPWQAERGSFKQRSKLKKEADKITHNIELHLEQVKHGTPGLPEEEIIFFKSILQRLRFTQQKMRRANIENCNNEIVLRMNEV